MTELALPDNVLVQVVDVVDRREISWGGGAVEKLRDRMGDIQDAVIAGARAISVDLDLLPVQPNWEVAEVSASFGLTLTAEAGVVLSRLAAETTFEVTVTLRRK